ncbi:hypothetical protein [Halobacteriovorax sp. HLS]|uniref:hypothetical protein n=1 Tax=Halobacteriovorax sp. HLS TaxID=2234000 RepID=UPI000FDCAA31|nr:hypothetical protein [Halobacteriovorax sp. HLS]
MKKLYYIEQEVFLRDLLAELCKQSPEFQCYSSDEGRNSLYFFQDIKPDVIVVDWATISSYEEELFGELSQVPNISVAITHESEVELPEQWKKRARITLEKPILAKEFLKNLFS